MRRRSSIVLVAVLSGRVFRSFSRLFYQGPGPERRAFLALDQQPMSILELDPHPLSKPLVFTTAFPASLGELPSPAWLIGLLRLAQEAPLQPDEPTRTLVRSMLRHGGYKPSGRGKPASEYLGRAAGEGALDSINLAVDACNATSLHSGFPISVVDLDGVQPPLRIRLGVAGESYVFNAAGQAIDLEGLLCLCDASGPCANAVKDAQRSKTSAATRKSLSIVWGVAGLEARLEQTLRWYRDLLARSGATTEVVPAG